MSGVEIVGLALAVFPLVIEGVERYHGVITGRDIKYLTESLKNNEQIFKNSVENLLRSSVESDELTVLLDNLQGTQWKDPKLERQVVDHLGQEAESILKKIKEIHDTVFKLQKRLPVRKAYRYPSIL